MCKHLEKLILFQLEFINFAILNDNITCKYYTNKNATVFKITGLNKYNPLQVIVYLHSIFLTSIAFANIGAVKNILLSTVITVDDIEKHINLAPNFLWHNEKTPTLSEWLNHYVPYVASHMSKKSYDNLDNITIVYGSVKNLSHYYNK